MGGEADRPQSDGAAGRAEDRTEGQAEALLRALSPPPRRGDLGSAKAYGAETAHLLRFPENAQRLVESLREARQGRRRPRELIEADE